MSSLDYTITDVVFGLLLFANFYKIDSTVSPKNEEFGGSSKNYNNYLILRKTKNCSFTSLHLR
jgi:hypothetical protein